MYEKLPENLTEKGFSTNKRFRKFKKLILTNKCFKGNNDITLIHKNTIISDQKWLTKLFNSYQKNFVAKSSGIKPKTFGKNSKNTSVESVRDNVNSYKDHPSIIKSKQVVIWFDVSGGERFSSKTINKIFWKFMKPFLTNKCYIGNNDITFIYKNYLQWKIID